MITLLPLMLGAVSGSPLPLVPADPPVFWAEMTNDNLLAVGKDDGATAGFGAGLHLGKLRVGAGYEMLTDRSRGLRSDELTVTAGWDLPVAGLDSFAGIGARFAGDFGGDSIQRQWHQSEGDEVFELQYEENGWRPVALVAARWAYQASANWGFDASASALGSYDMAQMSAMARVVFGNDGRIAVGPMWSEHVGRALSGSAASSYADTDGFGVAAALRMGALELRWEFLFSGAIYGTIGVVF